jgi:hypothetical protein
MASINPFEPVFGQPRDSAFSGWLDHEGIRYQALIFTIAPTRPGACSLRYKKQRSPLACGKETVQACRRFLP